MAANSKHYADVLVWLQRVIDSCKTEQQAHSAVTLTRLFAKVYNPHDDVNFIYHNANDLYRTAYQKEWDLMEIELKQKIKNYGTTSK